jgi:membrane protein implicated in regulation of membrane protease activity
MFLLIALVLFIFVPTPWNVFAGFASLVLFGFEVGYWQRRVRQQKVETGVGTLVGATGVVSEPLAPVGQVRVQGELWEAHSSSELAAGERVRVIAVNGLTLEVEPVARTVTNVRPAT